MDVIYILRRRSGDGISSDAGRYIGATVEGRERTRLQSHTHEARRGDVNHKCNWIRSIDESVILEVIELVSSEKRDEREKYWIALARDYGHRLTNIAEGGEGSRGHKQSPEWCARQSDRMRGKKLPLEWCEAISRAKKGCRGTQLGKTFPEEHRENLRIAILKTPARTDLPKGVHWCKVSKKFVAQLDFRGKNLNLGRHTSSEAAGLARDIAVVLYCPRGSFLNYLPAIVSATGPNFVSQL